MATNNATNTSKPISIAQGGTGASSMATSNGVVYYNGTDLVTTSAGTAGYVLTSNGSSSAPTYQSPSTGNLVFLASTTISTNTANVEFTSHITATYNSYYLIFSNVVPQTSTAVLQFNITANGSFTDITSGFTSGIWSIPYDSATVTNANSTSTVLLSGPLSTTAGLGAAGFINCFNVSNGDGFGITGNGVFNGSTAGAGAYAWYTTYNTADEALNGFQFKMSSGDISTGTFSLYGVLE